MKKIIMISAASLLLLAGCKDASVKVSNEKEVLYTIGNKQVTKGEVATALGNFKYNSTIDIIKTALYDELVPVNDEMNQEVEKRLTEVKNRVATTTVSWEDSLKSAGVNEEEYKEKIILPAVKADFLAKKYVEETFEERVKQYNPIKIAVMETSSQDKANEAMEAIKNGKSVTDAANEYGVVTQYKGETVVTYSGATNVIDIVYKDALSANDQDVKVVAGTSNNFYVYQLITKDSNSFKDEVIKSLTASTSIVNESLSYFLTQKKVEVYDIDVYNGLQSNYASAISNKK